MANAVMSLVATSSSRIRQLTIKNGQLIFIQDSGRIAFDFNNKRVFYNQIVEIENEAERLLMEDPLNGYYFVIGSGCLWHYNDEWTQITGKPESVVCIDVELPQLGQAKEGVLYVDKTDKQIAVFDSGANNYVVVSDFTKEVTEEDIENLFK
jgi:hypothetical protein